VALKLFVGGQISIETLRIIYDFYPLLVKWNTNTSIKYIWLDELRRIKKLTGFVKYDKIKLHNIFRHFLEEVTS